MSLNRRTVVAVLERNLPDGAKITELASQLDLGTAERRNLRVILRELMDAGDVERVSRGRYVLRRGSDEQPTGRISVHPAGYGFVARDDGEEDVFIPAKFRGSAMDGDTVALTTWDGYKGTEGRVQRVLSRGRVRLTGTLQSKGRTNYIEPDDPRVATDHGLIAVSGGSEAAMGNAVLIEIREYPTAKKPQMRGRVIRVLGPPEDPRTEMEKIIACAEIPNEFPEEALLQAKQTPTELCPSDFSDRLDLREKRFATIDPETARDFDDALCVEVLPSGITRVSIAVADVSHYVRSGDALDAESAIRGVSVYLPDRVVPMLPFALSSGICSLNPDVDRCAMVARIDFDEAANIVATDFCAAVICSKARLDYPGVAAVFADDVRRQHSRYKPWEEELGRLDKLARALRGRRMNRGALALELSEPKVLLDDDDTKLIRDVVRAKGNDDVRRAYELVEEFMIAANEAVGRFLTQNESSAIWRVHAPPKLQKLEELATLLRSNGISADVKEVQTPLGMSRILKRISDSKASEALSMLILRSLQQAVYQTENIGHFGLASSDYLHFTSPIRRYPDVLVHRLLKHVLHKMGKPSGGIETATRPEDSELSEVAANSSSHERRALEAERAAVGMCRAYVMRDQVGERFLAKIVGVTSFGIFVEIDSPYVEALIKLESLADDRFEFDPLRLQLHGRGTGATFSLGDIVEVEIINVSVATQRIDARIAGFEGQRTRQGRKPRESARKMALGRLALGRLALGRLALGRLALGRLALGRLALGRLVLGRLVLGKP